MKPSGRALGRGRTSFVGALSIALSIALLLAVASTLGCRDGAAIAEAPAVTVKGSDTLVTLTQRWAEVYMREKPGVVVQVSGGGSGTGFSAIINGTTDICQASRRMRPRERALFSRKVGGEPVEIEVARDGLAIFVNQNNPIDALTFSQLRAVFRGQIDNWKDLGGRDEPIVVYARESSSGTYLFFKETILQGHDYAASAQPMQGTGAVVHAVKHAKNGIGYGGAAYGRGVKILGVRRDEASPTVHPSARTVREGQYPLARSLFFYLAGPPRGANQAFVRWVLSPPGQALVSQVGYYPVI